MIVVQGRIAHLIDADEAGDELDMRGQWAERLDPDVVLRHAADNAHMRAVEICSKLIGVRI